MTSKIGLSTEDANEKQNQGFGQWNYSSGNLPPSNKQSLKNFT